MKEGVKIYDQKSNEKDKNHVNCFVHFFILFNLLKSNVFHSVLFARHFLPLHGIKPISMRTIAPFIFFSAMILAACNLSGKKQAESPEKLPAERIESEAFQQLLDGAAAQGTILMYDPQEDIFYSNDFGWCERGFLPASTFKIANTLIALETGVAEDETTLFPWDGQERSMAVWEQDLSLREAFHYSCVPCYQEIARKVGTERMIQWLDKVDYGNMVVTADNLDVFWLRGESRITPFEQVDFLHRFYFKELPVSEQTHTIMKNLMVIESQDDWTLSGKTGWAIRDGNNTGWFVGFLEKEQQVWFIATCIQPSEDFNMDMFNIIRRQISMEAFRVMGIIR